MLSVSYENLDENTYDAQSQALEKFHNRDYSPALAELKKMFPQSWKNIQLRTMPFIYSIARELGGALYSVEPSRAFEGVRSPEIEAAIRRIYEEAEINSSLRYAHEVLCLHAGVALLCLPDSAGSSRISVHVLAPWRVKPERESPLVKDERSINKWRVRLPRRETAYGTVQEEDLILTPETITWADGSPLYETEENPIGAIPLVTLRAGERCGAFWPAVNSDLLSCQINLILSYSDIGSIIHQQGWGQRVLTGGGMDATEIQVGPDTVLNLEENHDFKIVSGANANTVGGFIESTESFLRLVLSQNKVDPSALMSSGAYTAASRLVEQADRQTEKLIHRRAFERAENKLFNILARWTNAIRGFAVMPTGGVNVRLEYHEFSQPFDPLHESQASEIRAASGLESIVEQIAKERGISKAEASAVLDENLEIQRRIKMSAEPPATLEAVQ